MDRKTTGRLGEDHTARYLADNGYTIAARNWHCSRGELDIIAIRGDIIAFVEVKTRRPGAMVSPFEAVSLDKRRKLLYSAQLYLLDNPCELQPRFDVAAVTAQDAAVVDFVYLESAFGADSL